MTEKICNRCKKEILSNENYIKIEEHDHGSIIRINYMHKNCWDDLMDMKKKAFGFLRDVMNKTGFKKEEVIEIK